jgi:DNA-directed RNA polymerase
VLGDFLSELKGGLTPESQAQLPAIPEFGTLDLEDVKRSDFFFA